MAVGSIPIALAYRWMPRVLPSRWAQLIVLPALVGGLWTARELFMGSWPYTGFPWARIGMSQSESPLAHIASWTGVTGLTFLMVVFTAAVIEWLRAARLRDVRTAIPAAALALLLLVTPAVPDDTRGRPPRRQRAGQRPVGLLRRAGPATRC